MRIDVPCRRCWACRKNRLNDIVGRAMCERAFTDGAISLTLTYDDKKLDKPRQAEVIYKEDLQKFCKRWRRRVGKMRYIAAGEYGSKKGRTHFHAILMMSEYCPFAPIEQRFWDDYLWPYGHIFAEQVDVRKMRYVSKYINKRNLPGHDEWFTFSKVPLIGHDFIVEMAWRFAERRVMPRDMSYFPPGYNGKPKLRFSFYGKAQEILFDTLFDLWPEGRFRPLTLPMQNALRRYDLKKAHERWAHLPVEERLELIDSQLGLRVQMDPMKYKAFEFIELDDAR